MSVNLNLGEKMSDLENFVNQSGRDKGVKDVRKKIKILVLRIFIINSFQLQEEL